MQVKPLDRLTKLPESDTALTLAVLIETRQELSVRLVAQRNPHETVRLQGAMEFLDLVISKLTKS